MIKTLLVSVMVLSTLATIYMIGRPREPISHGTAVISVILNALIILGILSL